MAFSLEAALAVPLVISTWIGLLALAEPVYTETRQAAALEVEATRYDLEGTHLYEEKCLQNGNHRTSAIQTSPQAVLELWCLIADDCQLISRIFPEKSDWQTNPEAGK